MDQAIRHQLRQYYATDVNRRDRFELEAWKRIERDAFAQKLVAANAQSLLEIGAGTGRDALFFKRLGLSVQCIDLSPHMVDCCLQKGIQASVMDMARMQFDTDSFDAIYALNSLLHIPSNELIDVLGEISRVLKPSGYFFFGVYGGNRFEGERYDAVSDKNRFFSFYEDDQIRDIVAPLFVVEKFQAVEVRPDAPYHFQSMILRGLA